MITVQSIIIDARLAYAYSANLACCTLSGAALCSAMSEAARVRTASFHQAVILQNNALKRGVPCL